MYDTTRVDDGLLYFNGLNGSTGDYGLPPMTHEELLRFIMGQENQDHLDELRDRHAQSTITHYGVIPGVDPLNLAQAGWGVIFAHDANPAIKEALSELLQWRSQQAGPYFKVFEGSNGFQHDAPQKKYESKLDFLLRNGIAFGPADPEKVPYYLLLVGSPEVIPFEFQYQLDVQYAVGRIYFETVEEYANYARSVVQAEAKKLARPRTATFFSVTNPDDLPTRVSTHYLIRPLLADLQEKHDDWSFKVLEGEQATKSRLVQMLNGQEAPTLLFTASHGMEFDAGDPRQIAHQGAVVCQDWPGRVQWPPNTKPIPHDFYFAGDDLESTANLSGSMVFQFACFSGGTPQYSNFQRKSQVKIAPHPFLAQLPMKMLSRPKGGALAVVGHVDRAWGYSFVWPGLKKEQTDIYMGMVSQLLNGNPIGATIEQFNLKYAEVSAFLQQITIEMDAGATFNPEELVKWWTCNFDARNFAICGDPAVRLGITV